MDSRSGGRTGDLGRGAGNGMGRGWREVQREKRVEVRGAGGLEMRCEKKGRHQVRGTEARKREDTRARAKQDREPLHNVCRLSRGCTMTI